LGGTVQDATDCNDTEASINPAAIDVCGDGLDNDCDGSQPDPSTDLGESYCPAQNCQDILDTRVSAPLDGAYWLTADGGAAFEARCEMTTNGGGWNLVMNVEPADGNIVNYVNTEFWLDNAEYGDVSQAFTSDYKSPFAWRFSATNIMVQVANPGANGGVIGWKAWSMGSRSYDSFFHASNNTIQTNTVLGQDTASVYAYEAVIKQGSQLRSNMAHGPNTDLSRLAADSYSPHSDDNQPGLGTQMNAGCCGTTYRQMDVELWVNSSNNLWCTGPGNGSYAWLGSDGTCGVSCGSCQNDAGPGYSPYWTYRIYVR
jgi:hypothetical protein